MLAHGPQAEVVDMYSASLRAALCTRALLPSMGQSRNTSQASALPLEPVSRDASGPPARSSWLRRALKRAARLIWRLVRPVVLPLLLRGRSFLMAEMQQQMALLRGQLAEIQQQLREDRQLDVDRQRTDTAALTATLQLIEAVLLSLAASNRQ
jgi:hypothetical protein